ncbi:MAG: O-antigen ligase family protein [Candidatus Woesebacteria bacterium]|nr:MAG: O-antigen ligase family protein [Candidatus Woesebacteria bacterium]
MDYTKRLNFNNIFIFLFFVIFPFGQIIRIGILHPIDVIVGLAAFYAIFKKFKKPDFFKYVEGLLIAATFSWIFGSLMFRQTEVLYGLLYLLRLFAYSYFFIYICHFSMSGLKNKKLLLESLMSVSAISAIFGWIQFYKFPDIKPFFAWGWDMHLFRLVGTFLDPTFLGLILVFGVIISLYSYIDTWKRKDVLITIFLLVSLAFTYSRASYLALFVGLIPLVWHKGIFKKIIIPSILFIVLVFILPTTKNHSIQLFRSFSAIAKVENYQTTLKIFSKSPIFGIGYDNMCLAYQKIVGPQPFSSHACSGSDSSLLFILTTCGIAGLIVFIYSILNIGGLLARNSYFLILLSSFTALVVHSLFSNSMFYPWVMAYLLILLALCVKKKNLV